MTCYLTGFGAALPEREVTNAELAPQLGVTSEWIEASSGIRARRWANTDQSASELAADAVQAALRDAGLEAAQLDYLIGGTLSPDYQVPGIAPLVQHRLVGCRPVPALDVRAACAAILYSLQVAQGLLAAGTAQHIACFGAEAQSKGLDIHPRAAELSMLFGDGAGAVIVSRAPKPDGLSLRLLDVLIATDGNYAEDLIVRAPGTANGARWFDETQSLFGVMNGRTVILQAVRKLSEAALEITARNGLTLAQIDLVVPHQANLNLLQALGKRLGLAPERIVINLDRYGNTSGASAFLALQQAQEEKRFAAGEYVLVLAFGAGFTWGAALCQACE
ncbi:MAG: ketoacyl-ACP synthase III [Acidobacteria bacterium]|nr:ketoacyl-ACP synthase III [Acidobacteriota bacterium]MBI3422940.1 ketoacyl-ACP synthase III [Acidobacteriota bacterium]